jgi:hypothetical protein
MCGLDVVLCDGDFAPFVDDECRADDTGVQLGVEPSGLDRQVAPKLGHVAGGLDVVRCTRNSHLLNTHYYSLGRITLQYFSTQLAASSYTDNGRRTRPARYFAASKMSTCSTGMVNGSSPT